MRIRLRHQNSMSFQYQNELRNRNELELTSSKYGIRIFEQQQGGRGNNGGRSALIDGRITVAHQTV